MKRDKLGRFQEGEIKDYGIKVGDKFEFLTITKEPYPVKNKAGVNNAYVEVECVCGKVFRKRVDCLKTAKSCGCQRGVEKHGMCHTRLYQVWADMKTRCLNKKHKHYHNYGGRGIKVCEEWQQFENFYTWAKDKYAKGLSLDRIDNDGNYEPKNCRFADRKIQSRNTRTNVMVTAFGETKTLVEWVEDDRVCVEYDCLRQRIRNGMDLETAMTATEHAGYYYHEFNGERKNLKDWSETDVCMVAYTTLCQRISNGWSLEDALTTPPHETPTKQDT